MTGPSTLHMHVLSENFNQLESFINNKLYSVSSITKIDSQVFLKDLKAGLAIIFRNNCENFMLILIFIKIKYLHIVFLHKTIL